MKFPRSFLTLIIAFIVAYLISTYFLQFSLIQGDSMEPSYHSWQLTLINKRTKEIQHGDVIVFYSPNQKAHLTKRVVGCPGDTVEIKNGTLYINNTPSEHALPDIHISYAGIADTLINLNSNQYFVLGDNYEESIDSRYEEIGCISKEYILGSIIPQQSITSHK